MDNKELKVGMMAKCLPGFKNGDDLSDPLNAGSGYKEGALFRIREWDGGETIPSKYGPVRATACTVPSNKEIGKYVYQRKKEAGELKETPDISIVHKSRAGFFFRKANYTVFRSSGNPLLRVNKYVENYNNDTTILSIDKNIYYKEHIVLIDEKEYTRLKKAWNSIEVKPTVDGDSIFSCMRFDNNDFKKRYENVNELKSLMFERMMKRPDDNFEAYKCGWCGFYHIGKNQPGPHRKFWEEIGYFIKKIKFKNKLKHMLNKKD